MNTDWQEYCQTLNKELGDELAQEFVGNLYVQSRGDVRVATDFFYALGLKWAPLMHAWSAWIEEKSRSTIAIIMRDAKPLDVLPATTHWKRLYLNRLTCGVADELSGDTASKQHPLLKRYLEQNECLESFTFVDSGCYGTIVLELHMLGINPQPLFFFSRNPNIPGFLNELGISMAEGEVLNDSLECGFPHLYKRPSELVEKDGRIEVILDQSDLLSVRFGKAALRGIRNARVESHISAQETMHALLNLSQRAGSGEFTGILGHSSPEWSKNREFLANWPKLLCWV